MSEKRIYNVVGVTFEGRQDVLNDFFKNKYAVGGDYDCQLFLENDNQYDKNAVAVFLDTGNEFKSVGYISKGENVELRKIFGQIESVKLASMGPNYKGIIGLSIAVELDDNPVTAEI